MLPLEAAGRRGGPSVSCLADCELCERGEVSGTLHNFIRFGASVLFSEHFIGNHHWGKKIRQTGRWEDLCKQDECRSLDPGAGVGVGDRWCRSSALLDVGQTKLNCVARSRRLLSTLHARVVCIKPTEGIFAPEATFLYAPSSAFGRAKSTSSTRAPKSPARTPAVADQQFRMPARTQNWLGRFGADVCREK